MSQPSSVPRVLPQPPDMSYGIESLALFVTYTRESFRSTFGVEAPWWDPARPPKNWFDSSVEKLSPDAAVVYKVIIPDERGHWAMSELRLTAHEAASVNLAGAPVYPPYVIAPTGTLRGTTAQNPITLSLHSEALALLAETGASAVIDEGATPYFPVSYPGDEPRRMWALLFSSGAQVNVGLLLNARNQRGVGSPGRWDMASGFPVWVPNPLPPSGSDDPRPSVSVPVRDLLPNEELRPLQTALGPLGVQVVRTDLEQLTVAKDGGFTQGDRAMLTAIYRKFIA